MMSVYSLFLIVALMCVLLGFMFLTPKAKDKAFFQERGVTSLCGLREDTRLTQDAYEYLVEECEVVGNYLGGYVQLNYTTTTIDKNLLLPVLCHVGQMYYFVGMCKQGFVTPAYE